jgi:UPF0755 protein
MDPVPRPSHRTRLVALGATVVAAGAALAWINSPPPGARGGFFDIEPGWSARTTARRLKDDGRVRSRLWVELLARLLRSDQKLKAGLYRLPAGARADQILRDLIRGRGATVRFTVPEGHAVWQMADRLAALGVCDRDAFLREALPWEGFHFPETYFLEPNTPADRIAAALRERFDVVWAEVFAAAVVAGDVVSMAPGVAPTAPDEAFRLRDGRRWTVRQAVTMASLIERETRRDDERALVAAVYHGRLKKRMRLECDPTVQYALGGWKSPLTRSDLRVEHPYNTYRRFGLPPGPIAAPGRAALAAALSPAPVPYLYFVADAAGGHAFSATYEEHLKAVRRFRRALKEARNPIK